MSDETITKHDIFEYDSSIIKIIEELLSYESKETFNTQQTYSVKLTDDTVVDLIPNDSQAYVTYEDRNNFIKLYLNARTSEVDNQIAAIKKGLVKIIPESLLKRKYS